MQNYTKTGLLLLMIGMITGMIGNVLLFFTSFLIGSNILGLFGLIAISFVAGIGGLIMLIGALLIIIGRKEFGERHQKFTIYAVVIYIISIVIGGVLGVIFAMMSYVSGSYSYTYITSIITAILGGIAYIFLLYELEDHTGRYVLYAAYASSIVVAIFISLYSIGQFGEIFGPVYSTDTSSSSVMSATASVGKVAIFNLINGVLLLFAVYIPYRRIISGELVPASINPLGQSSSAPDRVCPNCNRSIPMDANTCPYCGKQFDSYL